MNAGCTYMQWRSIITIVKKFHNTMKDENGNWGELDLLIQCKNKIDNLLNMKSKNIYEHLVLQKIPDRRKSEIKL